MTKSILLVDDVQMFIEIEKEFLQEALADILTARDGMEALEMVKTRRPDIVFMDLEMPKMDGAASCRAIKSDPEITGTPVVMVTSLGNQENIERCISAGCDHFLTKPLDRNVFLNAARKFVPSIDRREKRVTVDIACTFRCREETSIGRLTDLSSGGAFVAAIYPALPGSVVNIFFTLPDGTPINCPGRVIWVHKEAAKPSKGFGVNFALMDKNAKTCLDKFLRSAG